MEIYKNYCKQKVMVNKIIGYKYVICQIQK